MYIYSYVYKYSYDSCLLLSFAEHSPLFLDIIFYIYILNLVPNSIFQIGATTDRPSLLATSIRPTLQQSLYVSVRLMRFLIWA